MIILKTMVWLTTLFNAAVGVIVLWLLQRRAVQRGKPSQVNLRYVATALMATISCCCTFALVGIVTGQLRIFGLIRLAYFNIAIVPAALGLFLLGLALKRNAIPSSWRIHTAGLILLIPAAVCAYASFIEPYRLKVEQVDVPLVSFDPAAEPIRITVLADIQTDQITSHERSAIDQALAAKPDLIVLPGDFFQGSRQQFDLVLPQYRELLGSLSAPGGVFASEGNIDRHGRLKQLFEGTPVRLLDNDIAVVNVRGRRLAMGGVEWDCHSPAAQNIFRAMRNIDADARILLCHTPDGALLSTPDDRIDLIISGHTHGGQIVIPGIGPPLTLARIPNKAAAGGLHRVGHQLLYISRGVGFERGASPPMRLFCPPEVSILTLHGIPADRTPHNPD